MSRIQAVFKSLSEKKRTALIPFVTAGDPDPGTAVELMHALAAAGADVIELGVPFSDPMADGPVIQRASERALKKGVSLNHVLSFVAEFRKRNTLTPVVLMGYANPIERMGTGAFAMKAQASGVDGVLVVDYPPEESVEFAKLMRVHDIDLIFLLAPTSTDERIAQVARLASGYIYYVSLKGVTGAKTIDLTAVAAMLPQIRKHTSLPVGVGFGIRDGETARAVSSLADAVVIGSRIIEQMEGAPPGQQVAQAREFLAGIRKALDA